jgi:hypothetical protein
MASPHAFIEKSKQSAMVVALTIVKATPSSE